MRTPACEYSRKRVFRDKVVGSVVESEAQKDVPTSSCKLMSESDHIPARGPPSVFSPFFPELGSSYAASIKTFHMPTTCKRLSLSSPSPSLSQPSDSSVHCLQLQWPLASFPSSASSLFLLQSHPQPPECEFLIHKLDPVTPLFSAH